MNKTLASYARNQLKEKLALCTSEQHSVFKAMYSHLNLEADVNHVVDAMPDDKLNHALTQVERTVEGNERRKAFE